MTARLRILQYCIVFICSLSLLRCQHPPTLSHQTSPIIGGVPSLEHPAVGVLTRDQTTFCTASLIAPRVVLTAGHCIDSARFAAAAGSRLQFRIDTKDDQAPEGFQTHHFDILPHLLSTHPRWDPDQVINGFDVGIAILSTPVPDTTAKPISFRQDPLPGQLQGQEVLFLGYGLIESQPHGISPNRKHAVSLPITQLSGDRIQTQGVNKSICHGDSGGPAIAVILGKTEVIAVNSYGASALVPGSQPRRSACDRYSVSVRTDTYKDYIRSWISLLATSAPTCQSDSDCTCGTCSAKNTCNEPAKTSSDCALCEFDSDCTSGSCIPTPQGKRCLSACTNQCCPRGFYCGDIKTDAGNKSLCMPIQGQCPQQACKEDKDCPIQLVCSAGQCVAPRAAQLCAPCQTNKDCGDNSLCRHTSAGRYCTQPCNNTYSCPYGFQCEQIVPGSPLQCVPTDGVCSLPCQKESDCPTGSGLTCVSSRCVPNKGVEEGGSCTEGGCKDNLQCVDTLEGKRCLRPCHISPGRVGGACVGEKTCTEADSICLPVRGLRRKYCFASCASQADCPYGGSCRQGVCVCSQDNECSTGASCDRSSGASTGLCIPDKDIVSCPAQMTCSGHVQGHFCVPDTKPGTRQQGQGCDAFSGCLGTLQCTQWRNHSATCAQTCGRDQDCSLGGRCTEGVCTCSLDSECPTGRSCHRFFLYGQRLRGLCRLSSYRGACISSSECPTGQTCAQGTCQHPPSEPAPEAPIETIPTEQIERTQEPLQDAGEPKVEPKQPDVSHREEPLSPETPRETLQETPVQGGCQCQTDTPQDWNVWLMLCLCVGWWIRLKRGRRGDSLD